MPLERKLAVGLRGPALNGWFCRVTLFLLGVTISDDFLRRFLFSAFEVLGNICT